MTIQLIRQTNKGVNAEFWKVKSCFYDLNAIEVEMNAYYDQNALTNNQVLDTIKVMSLDYSQNPLNKIETRQLFFDYLNNNLDKTPYEAGLYLLEYYIKNNITGWENSQII